MSIKEMPHRTDGDCLGNYQGRSRRTVECYLKSCRSAGPLELPEDDGDPAAARLPGSSSK